MKTCAFFGIAGILALAGAAVGQAGSGGTLTVGNARFTLGNFATTANGAITGITSANTADMFLNQGSTPNLDQLFGSSWFYRIAGVDTRELVLNNATAGATWVGNTGTVNFSFAGKFNATATYVLSNAPAGGATITQTLQVTNTTAAPYELNIYNYLDTFVRGQDAGDQLTNTGGTNFQIVDGPYTMTYTNPGALNYHAQAWSGSYRLVDALADELPNTGAPFTGDANLAVQWKISAAPNQPLTFVSTISVIPAPSSVALLGLGGLVAARRRRA
jgi:hypothetical protein